MSSDTSPDSGTGYVKLEQKQQFGVGGMIAVLMAVPSVPFTSRPLTTLIVPKGVFPMPIPHSFANSKPLLLAKKIVVIPYLYFENRQL